MSLKAGIEDEAAKSNKTSDFIYKSFSAADTSALDAAVLELKDAGVQAVIIASNQAPFKAAVRSLQINTLHVPVFTSYVNSDSTSIDPTINYSFDLYANAWVDAGKNAGADVGEFITIMTAADKGAYTTPATGIAYAIAGYIAAKVFVEGLERVGEDELTWKSYVEAMEEGPIDIPMGGTVDFSEGKRWGIASMSLLKLNSTVVPDSVPATYTHLWVLNKPIETLEAIQAK
jgi:ABC-type branched-subunit amino acid transport system substrate-binding protein